MGKTSGLVFDIQRFSLHDGPGIRTTVFLKGCPLRCRWCHNPESWSPKPVLLFTSRLCVGCGACRAACPRGAHSVEGKRRFDRSLCAACGRCVGGCPTGALRLAGRRLEVKEVVSDVLRDRLFYEYSGGGMTVSGGEPLFQAGFTLALLKAARREGLHTAVETCGFGPFDRLEALLPVTGLFLFDIKAGASRHRRQTGVPAAGILENLERLARAGARIWLRVPLVPGFNVGPELFKLVAGLARELPGVERVELLPYHRLGEGKYLDLGLANPAAGLTAPSKARVSSWLGKFERLGIQAGVV